MLSTAELLKNNSEASGEKQDKNDLVENIVLIEEFLMQTAEQDRTGT